jgi:hypothetical protein
LEALAVELMACAHEARASLLGAEDERLLTMLAARTSGSFVGVDSERRLVDALFLAAQAFGQRATTADTLMRRRWAELLLDCAKRWADEMGPSARQQRMADAVAGAAQLVSSLILDNTSAELLSTATSVASTSRSSAAAAAPLKSEQCIEAIAPWLVDELHRGDDPLLLAAMSAATAARSVLQSARRAVDDSDAGAAVTEGRASVAQLSTWRHANPRARARGGGSCHPALDLLHPLFACLEELEADTLSSSPASPTTVRCMRAGGWLDTIQQVCLHGISLNITHYALSCPHMCF